MTRQDSPKSATLAHTELVRSRDMMNTLEERRSRWQIGGEMAVRYDMARAMSSAKRMRRERGKGGGGRQARFCLLCSSIKSRRLPCGQSSMTMRSGFRLTPIRCTMKGDLRLLIMNTSLTVSLYISSMSCRGVSLSSSPSLPAMSSLKEGTLGSLTATGMPWYMPSYTTPNPPSPIFLTVVNSNGSISGKSVKEMSGARKSIRTAQPALQMPRQYTKALPCSSASTTSSKSK
mmetsp:Transcript_26794/g.67348  ORF Transcript_26794/g.67348 Transcript_26794/m.67348 type:complete len:232 (-) Transcript_26794:117-812(-)